MKTLNLDKLAKVTRSVTIGGKEYAVEEMTVKNFIETSAAAEALSQGSEATLTQQLEETIKALGRSIPTLDESVLRQMTFEQIGTLSKFIRGELDDAAPEPTQEGDEKK